MLHCLMLHNSFANSHLGSTQNLLSKLALLESRFFTPRQYREKHKILVVHILNLLEQLIRALFAAIKFHLFDGYIHNINNTLCSLMSIGKRQIYWNLASLSIVYKRFRLNPYIYWPTALLAI